VLAASPALFPSAASAKPQRNNPVPVTEREWGGWGTEGESKTERGRTREERGGQLKN